MVSGHATNVTVIGCLLGAGDLVVHDSFSHNSVVQGGDAVRRAAGQLPA